MTGRAGLWATCALLAASGVVLLASGGQATSFGLLALAGIGGVLAVDGILRRALGALLLLAGILGLVVVDGVAALGAGLLVLAGLWVAVAGGRWSRLGRRYAVGDRPAAADDPWRAIDRGEDPTT